MLSWNLWRAIRDTPPHWRLHRLLMSHESAQPPRMQWFYMLLAALVMIRFFPYLLPLLVVHVFGLEMVWKIANAIAEQHELGRRDLIAMTPSIGDFGLSLEICRLYWDAVTERISSGFWRFGAAGVIAVFLLSFVLGGFSGILFVIGSSMLAVPLMYIEYRHALVTAAFVGILAGFVGERGKARAFAVGGYLALHIGLYMLGLAMLSSVLALAGMMPTPFLVLFVFGGAALVIFYALREAVVFGLWQWLRWQINDDVPALKVIIQQG